MIKIDYTRLNNNIILIVIFGLMIITSITFISFYTTKQNLLNQYKYDSEKIISIFKNNLNHTALSFEYFRAINFEENEENILSQFRKIAKTVFNQSNILNSIELTKQFENIDDSQINAQLKMLDSNSSIKQIQTYTQEEIAQNHSLKAIVYDIYPINKSSINIRGLDLRSEKHRHFAISNIDNANFSISHPVKAFDAINNKFVLSSIIFSSAYKPKNSFHSQWLIASSITFENFLKNFIELSPLLKSYKFEFKDSTISANEILLFTNKDDISTTLALDEYIEFGERVYKLSVYAPSPYSLSNFWQPILGFFSGLLFLMLVTYYVQYKIKNEEQLSLAQNNLLKAEQIGKMGHFTLKANNSTILCSNEVMQILDLKQETIHFNDLKKIIDILDFTKIEQLLQSLKSASSYSEGEFEFKAIINSKTKFIKVVYNANYINEQLQEVFGIAQDITVQKELELAITSQKEHFKQLATTDYLTKIYNRVYISDFMTNFIHQHKRYGQIFSIVLFDIDYFKHVNDTYGHLEGDKVLIAIASCVKKSIRETDMFARWGGEEFLLILNNTDLENATWVSENLRIAIEKLSIIEHHKVTCSFGVTCIKDGDTEDSLLQRVDSLLYAAKGLGRNKVVQG